jgi:Ca2+:H+ antiporter
MADIHKEKLKVFATTARQSVIAGDKDKDSQMSDTQILKMLLMEKINVMLIFAPIGIISDWLELSKATTFTLCFLGLMPLAKILGDATEHLAENLNQTIGGLLNATFGNAVEMIITMSAIGQGKLEIVKNSLLGSILSNLLLVLGMSFFAGGLVRMEQHFSGAAALINVTMLFVGTMSFSLSTIFAWSAPQANILGISRLSAVFIFIGYIAYLYFQLHTHAEMFEDDPGGEEAQADEDFTGTSVDFEDPLGDLITFTQNADGGIDYLVNGRVVVTDLYEVHLEGHRIMLEGSPATNSGHEQNRSCQLAHGQEEKGRQVLALVTRAINPEENEAVLSVKAAMIVLLSSTIVVAFLSEFMVDAIDGLVVEWGVPEAFVGVILLPIVGNACEHASAVRMAYVNKVATAIAIAVGSSTQIALFVMPFSVIAGWTMGQPLDFNLHATGLAILFMSVLVVFSIVTDGKSNWLAGFMLMLCYCIVAVLYWYTPNSKKG